MMFYKQILDVSVFPLMMILKGLKRIAVCYFYISNSKKKVLFV